jgi:hypothetical protein
MQESNLTYNACKVVTQTFSSAQQILALSCFSSPQAPLDSFLPAKESVYNLLHE